MKRTTVTLAFLLLTSSVVFAQAGRAGQENNLRGLKGVRLVVMFARAEAIDESERPAILKLVEADSIEKFQQAGISLLRYADEVEEAGSPLLTVYITCDKPNGFVYPVVTNVTLLQRVRLTRDPSIAANLATWEQSGVGAWDPGIGTPDLSVKTIRSLVATEINQFIKDYKAVNLTTAQR